jgi:hypothetical protein
LPFVRLIDTGVSGRFSYRRSAVTGKEFKGLLLAMLPSEVVREAAPRLKVQQRARVLDVVALVWALVLAGGTEECGRLASTMRSYIKETGRPKLSRSAFYQWFDAELLAMIQELVAHCCRYVEAQPRHLPGIMSGRRDWRAVDSTVIKLPDELLQHYPGTGDYASLKVHKVYSLGAENVVGYHLTPGRDHDASPPVHLAPPAPVAWDPGGLVPP